MPAEEAPADVKPSPSKKPAGKKDTKAAVEEITDNRPRTVQYKREVADEHGGAGVKLTEPIASKLTSTKFVLEIMKDDKPIEKIQFSMNELLWLNQGHTVS